MVHPLITLYPSTEEKFEDNGLGSLAEAVTCVVTEGANAEFELEMTYPINGRRYLDLKNRRIIYTKPNPIDPPQAFRIYEITKPMKGVTTVYASHISYDLSGYPVKAFEATGAVEALSKLKANAVVKHPFEFWTDMNSSGEFSLTKPVSTRSALGGMEGSILDIYHGEYKFDNFLIRLYANRGEDRGVSIRYGKNLTDFKQEENCSAVYTGVLPYWESQDSIVALSEPIPAEGTYDFTNILILDLSSEFEDPPYESDLEEVATVYMEANDIGKPKISIDISFAQLEQTDEYKNIALLERVQLFDTVTVEFQEMGVSATAKVNKTVYNCLTGRYTSVSVGDVRANITDSISDQREYIDEQIQNSKSDLEKSVERATQWIVNGRGYMVAVTPNIYEALHVWRWNNAGFGYSSEGYNGPYRTAITQDGHIVADFIDTGTFTATLIKTGVLQSKDGGETFYLDLDNGILRFNADSLDIKGKPIADHIEASIKDLSSLYVFLSNEYEGVLTDNNGNYGASLSVDTTISASCAGEDVTAECILHASPSSGVTGGWDSSLRNRYIVTKLTTDEGYVDFTVSYKEQIVTKRFNIAKVKNGADGTPKYTWLKYANNTTGSGMSDSPTGKTYMGLAFNKDTPTESTDYRDYQWSLIKGTDGVPGSPGKDGKTLYTWIKYAENSFGGGMSDLPDGKT